MVNFCYKQKSTLIKCLIFLVSVLIMILVGLAIVLVKRNEEHYICKTEKCIKLSAEVMRYMDQSKDACDDFYTFTCGGFLKNHKEVPQATTKEVLNMMVSKMVQNGDSKQFIMEKSFYLACNNLAGIELDDDEMLLDQFYALGDWPVLRGANWDGLLFDWTDIAKKSRRLGMKFDWFLDFSIYEDVNDTGLNLLKIDIPPLKPLRESEIFPRQKLLTRIAVTLGAPEKLAHYETGRTIEFENVLRTVAHEHRRDKKHLNATTLPKITIHEVQKLWPSIKWLELLSSVTGVKMVETDRVIFDEVLNYIKDLNKLIYGTPKRIVADYMMWKIVEENWQYLTQPVRALFEDYYQRQHNVEPELDRQKFCINESRKQFPLIVESEYIRRHGNIQKRQLVKEMLEAIQRNYRKLLNEATWMNRRRKEIALRRLDHLQFLVGGPREVFDEFRFAEDLGLYGFIFKSNNVMDMLNQRRLRYYDHYFSTVNRGVTNRTLAFYEKAININRFTIINNNTLVIPATLLRDNFYDPSLPNHFNYATLGKFVAHKIFEHIFERKNNVTIDEESHWWISDGFDNALKCLIREFADFHNSELKRPKKMRELLAHFVSTEVAYDSYKELSIYRLDSQQSKLQSLEFTPDQLFWIHTSKLHCNKIYSKYDRDYSRFKIIAPLRNSRNFARDYNCQMGAKMYAKKTCRIL